MPPGDICLRAVTAWAAVATGLTAAAPSHPVAPVVSLGAVINALPARDRTHTCRTRSLYAPNKDKPGVKEATAVSYKEWLQHRKKFNKKRKEKPSPTKC